MGNVKLRSFGLSTSLKPFNFIIKLKRFAFLLCLPAMLTWLYVDISQVSNEESSSKFLQMIKSFPWDDYQFAMETNNLTVFEKSSNALFHAILPILTMPPKVKVNESCKPPHLVFPSYAPECKRLTKPRKIAVLIQLGFDVDMLEIHLHELDDLVDHFFLLESTRSHFSGSSKPLIWERLKDQLRFSQFLPKVVHLILDDVDVVGKVHLLKKHGSLKDLPTFGIEFLQERLRFHKFIKWNKVTQHFQLDDLIGIGDADEIPNRNVIHYLKNCDMPSDPIDIGIWFPFGRINQVFKSDWPVKGHPYTYGDPTYWTLRTALALPRGKYPTRQRGKSPGFILGGMHMTHYGYLPYQLVKSVSGSGPNPNRTRKLFEKLKNIKNQKDLLELEEYKRQVPEEYRHRILNISVFAQKFPFEYDKIVKFPWWYDCNRERYPAWEGKHDKRLD